MVLGGGDGGVLKELLELSHPPEYVTMIELDNEKMDKDMDRIVLENMEREIGIELKEWRRDKEVLMAELEKL